MRYALALLTAVLVAAAVYATALEPTDARAQSSYDGNVEACNGKQVYLRPAEKSTLRLHNKARANRGIPRLCIQQQLQRAARKHSADMIRKDYFSHRSKDGSTFSGRVKREGYTAKGMSVYRIGENIGGGSGSYGAPQSRHRAWMNSQGHRENMLDGGFRHVGIGVAAGNYNGNDDYRMYTVDFGLRCH